MPSQKNTSFSMGDIKNTTVGMSIHSGYAAPVFTPRSGSAIILMAMKKANTAVSGRL